jgi:hypothetical protein
MKTKKVLACLLLISLTAATVCSCGKGETASAGTMSAGTHTRIPEKNTRVVSHEATLIVSLQVLIT